MPAVPAFRHEALFYRGGAEGFADAIAPMVAATLAAGGRAAVATPGDRLASLRSRLGASERVELLDMREVGVNPARIIPRWRDLADAALADGAPFLGVGEPVWADRRPEEIDECHRHEALINVAFAADPEWRLVCPYDADGLDPEVLAGARSTHPTVVDADGSLSHGDVDGIAAFRALERGLVPPPGEASRMPFDRDSLGDARELARGHARRAGLPPERIDDLCLAVTELATNGIRHGGGGGRLTVWHGPGVVMCETSDAGVMTDPMAGRVRPDLDRPSGRGLWIVHQLCDLVQVRSSGRGTVVRFTLS